MIPSRKSFISWFKKQRGSRKFDYCSNCDCLIATWLKETKVSDNVYAFTSNVLINGLGYSFPRWLQDLNGTMMRLSEEFTIKDLRTALKA